MIAAVSKKGCSDATWSAGLKEIAGVRSKVPSLKAMLILTTETSVTMAQQRLVREKFASAFELAKGARTAVVGDEVPKIDTPIAVGIWFSKNPILLKSFAVKDVAKALAWLAEDTAFDSTEASGIIATLQQHIGT